MLQLPTILTIGAFALTLLVHAVIIGRWSSKLQIIVEQLKADHQDLKKLVERHDRTLDDLRVQVAVDIAVRQALEKHKTKAVVEEK